MNIAEQQKFNLLDQCIGIKRGFVKGCEGGDRNWKSKKLCNSTFLSPVH
jgi:hypothetical protein